MPKCLICILSIILIIWPASCAKRPILVTGDMPKKVKIFDDPLARTYFDFMQAEMARYEDDPKLAMEKIDELIKNDPNVGYFYYERALVEAGSENWEKVVADCRLALAKDPKNYDAKILLGKSLGTLNKRHEAVKYLEEVRREKADYEMVYPILAKEYLNMEEYGKAERVMLDLLARDTEALIAYYYLGAIYGSYMKRPDKAIQVYEKILVREPENIQVIDAVSQLYIEMGKPGKALEKLLDIEAQRESDVSLKLKVALLYYKMRKYDEAILRFEDILRQNPDSDKIMYYLGVLYEEVKKFDDAIKMFSNVPPVSGLYKDARLRLAYRYVEGGNPDLAKVSLQQAIHKKPDVIEFYQYLGALYEKEGDIKNAVNIFKAAARAFPGNEKIWFGLGSLYERMGETDKAIEMMFKVLKINPQNASALNYVGYTYADRGVKLDEAEKMLQEAAHLKPDDGYIVDSLGWLYFKKGDFTKAGQLIKRAVSMEPNEPTILRHLGEVYLKKGELEEAIKYFRQSLKAWEKKERVDAKEIEETISLIEEARKGM